MSKCKNCIHYEACLMVLRTVGKENKERAEQILSKTDEIDLPCEEYKDKSLCVEVVRCKDCIYRQETSIKEIPKDVLWCDKLETCAHENHYCSYGERKLREVGMSKVLKHGRFYKEKPSKTYVRCPECNKKVYCYIEGYPRILICTCGCEFEFEYQDIIQESEENE